MTIKIGDTVPNVTLKMLGASGMQELQTLPAISDKKVIIFGVPGAFTPTCAQQHLPGYIAMADGLKAKGIDEIICVSVNDPFVMQHWGEVANANGKVTLWPDGNASFADALGLTFDGSGAGLNKRAQRFMMVVDKGVVQDLQIEGKPSDHELTSANTCMLRLG